jgi:hypothetical protein
MSLFLTTLAQTTTEESIFGKVEAPPGVADYDAAAGGIGLVLFVSNLIRIITIVGGVFVMVNIIYAGWIYISSSGNADAHTKVADTIIYSIIGLAIIVGSYAAAALAGVIFFGDATFILSPTICGPEGC